jgi:DNA-binding NarL/FixJ family response regulator
MPLLRSYDLGERLRRVDPAIMLVDDHPLWRETLKKVIQSRSIGRVVAEASDGADAVEVAVSAEPDVVVMDMALPTMGGAEATRRIRALLPDVKVLVLSSFEARPSVLDALRAGASGYLLKTAGANEVADAIERVAQGELVFPGRLAGVVLEEFRKLPDSVVDPAVAEGVVERSSNSPGLKDLTDREREVIALMAEGRSNQAICERLYLSGKTLEKHIRSIFTKLGLQETADAHRRVQAVIAYLRSV